jgi:hypothetical protein
MPSDGKSSHCLWQGVQLQQKIAAAEKGDNQTEDPDDPGNKMFKKKYCYKMSLYIQFLDKNIYSIITLTF